MKLLILTPQTFANNAEDCECNEPQTCTLECLDWGSGTDVSYRWSVIDQTCACNGCDAWATECDPNVVGIGLASRKTEPCGQPSPCFAGMDENNCVIIGYCGVTETCEHICSPENPCTNEAKDGDPCCDAIIICDQDINSPNCGGCMWEQSGEPANECFQCEDLVCQCPENPDGPPGGGPPTPGGGELPPSPPPSPPSPPPGGPGDLPPEEPPWEPKPDDPVDPGDPKEEPPVIGPPKPNPNPPDPCEEADILEETINKPETEEICDCDDCGTETKYSCYNNECVENRYGKYNSLLDCLKILCDNSGVCNDDDQFFIPKG